MFAIIENNSPSIVIRRLNPNLPNQMKKSLNGVLHMFETKESLKEFINTWIDEILDKQDVKE